MTLFGVMINPKVRLIPELFLDPTVATILTIVSIVSLVAGVILTPWIVSRLARDFFLPTHQHSSIATTVVRNIFGYLLLLLGVVMLVTPGQGLVTILLALAVVDFPYKHRVLEEIVARPSIRRTLNRWRQKFGAEHFLFPEQK